MQVDGRKLTDIINTDHVNSKYLPGIPLPLNVVASSDIHEACSTADLIFFVVPHQFLGGNCQRPIIVIQPSASRHTKITTIAIRLIFCTFIIGVLRQLKGHVKSTAIGVSLIKGLHVGFEGPVLLSHMIKSELSLYNDVAVVMGANVASEVAMVTLYLNQIGSYIHQIVLDELYFQQKRFMHSLNMIRY